MKKLLLFVLVLLAVLPAAAQQDIVIVGGTSPYIILGRGLNWSGSGFGNIQNNFIFTPTGPDVGFCLFLQNNNPSSAHSVTVAVAQTGDPGLKAFQGVTGKWNTVPTTTSFPISVAAGTVSGINYKTSASANITVTFSGTSAQAGVPDTVDVFAVQTVQSSCGALSSNSVQGVYTNGATVTNAQDFPLLVGGLASPGITGAALASHIGTTGQGWLIDGGVCCQSFASGFQANPAGIFSNLKGATGTSTELEATIDNFSLGFFGAKGTFPGFVKTNFLEIATDQFALTASNTPAWVVLGKLTNPATGATLLSQFNTTASAVNPALKTLVLSCSAACELLVARITARGTTCATLTPQNLQFGNNNIQLAPSAADISENACTGAPTAGTSMFDLNLAAGTPLTLDMSGFANFHNAGGGSGWMVQVVTGITGIATASLTWAEQ